MSDSSEFHMTQQGEGIVGTRSHSRCKTKGMKMMACGIRDQPSLAVAEPTAILTM